MIDAHRTALTSPDDGAGLRRLVTKSLAVTPANALGQLGFAVGDARDYLASGEWLPLDRHRVRLVPVPPDDSRADRAFALVETEHANILVPDEPEGAPEEARAA